MLKRGNKRAVLGFIVKFILMLVVLVLILGFIYKLYANSAKFNSEQACHDALVLQQTLSEKITGAKYAKPWPSVCKTQDKVITAKNPQDAERELAELMSWCWWEMGEGVIKPFDQDWFSGGRKCFVCYTAQFPNLKETVNEPDFSFYLQQQGRKGTSYYSYLKYGEDKLIDKPLTDPIKKDNVYVVVYTSPSDPTFGFIVTCLKPALEGGAAAAAAGAIGCGAIGAVIAGPPGAIVGALYCGIAGAQWGAIGTYAACGAKGTVETVAKYVQQSREDLVYVSDANRGKAGCFGSWYEDVGEVHTNQ